MPCEGFHIFKILKNFIKDIIKIEMFISNIYILKIFSALWLDPETKYFRADLNPTNISK